MNFEHIQNLLRGLNEEEFSGGVSISSISSAEEKLGIKFPSDYVEFLTKLGSGYASSEEFLGLGGAPHLDVVEVSTQLRVPSSYSFFPSSLIPVKADGYGNYDCIDLENSSSETSRIVLWLHDGGDNQEYEIISDNYWDWLEKEIKTVQEFDAQA